MNASDIRRKARETMESNFLISVLGGSIASTLSGLLANSSVNISYNSGFQFNIGDDSLGAYSQIFIVLFVILFCFLLIYSIVYSILGGTVQLGYAQFLLKQQDQQEYSELDLFSQFHRLKEGFLQVLLRGLFVFLWSLLFVIPGIIKSYSYAMTPFIMAENPNMSASEAITASKELMDGHKWELFCLDLSFIGWSILSALTFGAGIYIFHPYKNTAYAVFYRSITKPTTTL